jgi:Flp pilus assembly pilin Flp
MAEYALVLLAIAVAVVAVYQTVGEEVFALVQSVADLF